MIIYTWDDVVNHRVPTSESFGTVIDVMRQYLKSVKGVAAATLVGETNPAKLSCCDDLCLLIVYDELNKDKLIHVVNKLNTIASKNHVRLDFTVVEKTIASTNATHLDPKYTRHALETFMSGGSIVGDHHQFLFLRGDKSSWYRDDLRRVIADTDRTLFYWHTADERGRCGLVGAALKRVPYVAAQMLESEYNILLSLDANDVVETFKTTVGGKAAELLSRLFEFRMICVEGLQQEL